MQILKTIYCNFLDKLRPYNDLFLMNIILIKQITQHKFVYLSDLYEFKIIIQNYSLVFNK